MKSFVADDPFMPTHADKIGERRGERALAGAAGGAEESVSENDRATLFATSSPNELAAFFVGRCVFYRWLPWLGERRMFAASEA